MSVSRPVIPLKRQIVNLGLLLLLVLSLTFNGILVLIIFDEIPIPQIILKLENRESSSEKFKTWPTWLTDKRPNMTDTNPSQYQLASNNFPRFRGKLSHVLFSMLDTPKEVANLKETLALWEKSPPCLVDSYPTTFDNSQIPLVIYFDTFPSKETVQSFKLAFWRLPFQVRNCFSKVEIRHAGLPKLDEAAGIPPTPGEERERWRQVFKTLITNSIGLSKVNHVLILTSDCRPVQPNWLNIVDYAVRPPNDHTWLRGSIFHGYIERPPMNIAQLLRISSAGLYFFGDGAFTDFYLTRVLPWASKNPQPIVPEYGDRWTVDILQYLASDVDGEKIWFRVSHQFRHANFISDYHGRNVSLTRIHQNNPDTVLVCGILVP